MTEEDRQVRYTGSPALAALFVRELRDDGVEVDFRPQAELRDFQSAAEAVVVVLTCRGTEAAIKAAVAKFRQRFPKAEIDLKPGDDRGYR